MPQKPLNIIVLGGSFAGLSVAHYVLDHIIHQLSTFDRAPTYRVVLVSPSTHLYWNICAPRAIISPDIIPTEDAFVPIEPGFSHHPFNEFTFMQGVAKTVDTSAKTVTIELVSSESKRDSGISKGNVWPEEAPDSQMSSIKRNASYRVASADGDSRIQKLSYHALILATGSSAHSPLFSLHGKHEDTMKEVKGFQKRLEAVHSILIVGGGPTGCETAGQLSTYYNRSQSWKTSRRSSASSEVSPTSYKQKLLQPLLHLSASTISLFASQTSMPNKTITLLSGSTRLLPKLHRSIGEKAEKQLKSLGVHVVHNIRQISTTSNPDGTMNCILNNDMTITSDIVISATGVYPNTSYLNPEMLDENGYVITDVETLRIYGHDIGERVYALGDCAAYSKNYTLDVFDAVPVLAQNLKNDLLIHEYRLQTQAPAAQDDKGETNSPVRPPRPPSPGIPLDLSHRITMPAPSLHYLDRQGSREAVFTPAEAKRKIDELEDAKFIQNPTDSQLMPITRLGGVGIVFDTKLPSFIVWVLKGRDYKMGKRHDVVRLGKNPYAIK